MKTLAFAMAAAIAAAATGAAAEPARAAGSDMDIAGPVLMVTDLERSLRFYVDGLGMKVVRQLPGNPGPGAVLAPAGSAPPPHLLIRQRAAAPGGPPVEVGDGLSRVMLSVADAAAIARRLRSAGYAPGPISGGGIFFVKDPDGYAYEVIQRARGR